MTTTPDTCLKRGDLWDPEGHKQKPLFVLAELAEGWYLCLKLFDSTRDRVRLVVAEPDNAKAFTQRRFNVELLPDETPSLRITTANRQRLADREPGLVEAVEAWVADPRNVDAARFFANNPTTPVHMAGYWRGRECEKTLAEMDREDLLDEARKQFNDLAVREADAKAEAAWLRSENDRLRRANSRGYSRGWSVGHRVGYDEATEEAEEAQAEVADMLTAARAAQAKTEADKVKAIEEAFTQGWEAGHGNAVQFHAAGLAEGYEAGEALASGKAKRN